MAWNTKYKEDDLRLIPSKPILSDFGKALDVEDRVELHIFSQDGSRMLFSNPDVTSYKVAEGGILDSGNINQDSVVFLDLHNDLREYVNAGTFLVKYCFYRTLVGSPDQGINDLFIDEISPSRTEIRLKISPDATQEEKEILEDFADKLSIKGDVDHWVDVHVNFGNNVVPLAVNWSIDKITTPEFPYSIVLKLYEPLPEGIELKQPCWIVQEIISSVQETVFVEGTVAEKQVNFLAQPNFSAGNEDGLSSGTTRYHNWVSLTDAKESVLDKILNKYFSGSLDDTRLSIDYRHYEHFIRFGSAEERLKNFRYKLSQIEFYDGKIAELSTKAPVTGSDPNVTGSFHFVQNVQNFKIKKNEIIAKFDGYETFLYNESASYVTSSLGEHYPATWPKLSDQKFPKGPYQVLSVTSSDAIDWYDGAIASASLFDRQNIHALRNQAVPLHIHEDPTLGTDEKINSEYIKFVDMVGEFYDNIYLYITAIPEMWDRHNPIDAKLIEGQFSGSDMMSKDLIYTGLKNLGYQQCLKSDEEDLWTYVLGTDASGSFGYKQIYEETDDWGYWNAPDNQFASASYVLGQSPFIQNRIYASDHYQTSQSVPIENLRLEFGKRLLNNLPYLQRTKGTLENLKAYMNIYGIPQTLFRIKEWGTPVSPNYFGNEYYEYDVFNYGLHFDGSSALTASWDAVTHPLIKEANGDRVQFPDTIEFRFKLPDMFEHDVKCGRTRLDSVSFNANKKDMAIIQINSSSFISVEHVSNYLPSGSETYDFNVGENSHYGRAVFGLLTLSGSTKYFVSASTDWAPIFDGDWWNIMVRRNEPTASAVVNQVSENFTYDLFCKKSTDWARATITHEVSASLTTNGSTAAGRIANQSWNSDGFSNDLYVSMSYYTPDNTAGGGYTVGTFGENYDSFYIGGQVNSTDWKITDYIGNKTYGNFSGSMQELRFWMKPLTESAFNHHVLNPMAIDGNNYTSSYSDLIVRYSLGADLRTYPLADGDIISSTHPNQDITTPFTNNRSTFATASGFAGARDFQFQQERVATIVPNYIGMNPGKDKIRIQSNVLASGSNLSVNKTAIDAKSIEGPRDINRVSVQMTPVDQINIDIEHQLGGIEFNDLVGDPRSKFISFYPDCVFYNNHYWLKHFGPFKYSEFFKLIRYYDDTVLCQMKKNVPGRNKPDFNIAIEPHILERPRIPERRPVYDHVQLEGSASARVYLEGGTTELGRFKHNGPGDPYYSDWDNRGPLESRYGDRVNPRHRAGTRVQAHILPQPDISYGTGGQRERERNVTGLFRTTVGEIEVTVNRNPYAPIIKDDIFMCWERDQHEGAAIYEYHQTLHWSGSFGAYTDYSVTGTSTIAATKGKVKIELAGTFPNPGLEHYSSRSIVLTSTDGTVTEIRCHDSGSPSEGSTASDGTQVDGVNFLYDNNPQNLAINISKSIGALPGFTCGPVHQDGTVLASSGDQTAKFIVHITQSTAGKNGNTTMGGDFFPPYDYNPITGQTNTKLFQAHSASRIHVFPVSDTFSGGDDVRIKTNISALSDSVRTSVTQANAYYERDTLQIVSHPMDPREEERFYDFNKNEYIKTNLHPNKPMFNRTKNYPIINNGLTSYADNQTCRDRGKEWFFPMIGNQTVSFYKFTELHRFATELSQSLGIKVPRVQFGQADLGYGNLDGQSIVSHSGAPIRNLEAESVLSRSAQYQDYRAKGLQNLIYDGCMMSASDFNIDSPQTIDGGPIVEVIDTTPFKITADQPTLGEGPGRTAGEGIGRGVGKYSGRPISRNPAAGRGQAFTGGRYNYLRPARDVQEGTTTGNQVR